MAAASVQRRLRSARVSAAQSNELFDPVASATARSAIRRDRRRCRDAARNRGGRRIRLLVVPLGAAACAASARQRRGLRPQRLACLSRTEETWDEAEAAGAIAAVLRDPARWRQQSLALQDFVSDPSRAAVVARIVAALHAGTQSGSCSAPPSLPPVRFRPAALAGADRGGPDGPGRHPADLPGLVSYPACPTQRSLGCPIPTPISISDRRPIRSSTFPHQAPCGGTTSASTPRCCATTPPGCTT